MAEALRKGELYEVTQLTSARAEAEILVCSVCLSPVPISEGSDSCHDLYTMVCSTSVDWLVWLKTIEDICHGGCHCCYKGAVSSLPPVCWCAGKRQKDIKWSAWKMFTRHLESFQSRDISSPSRWGTPVLLSKACLGAICLQNWNREDIHPTLVTQYPPGGPKRATKLWTQPVRFWIHDLAI